MKKIFCATLLMTISIFAGVKETRQVLNQYSSSSPNVLELYDQTSALWIGQTSEQDQEKLLQAVEYAAQKHFGQTRKDAEKTPYIVHPIGVSKILIEEGNVCNVDVLTAALLHDTLEDTDATEQEIQNLFGDKVLSIVIEVTNDPSLSGQENKQRQIDHAPSMTQEAKLVKLADRLYNVRDLTPPPPSWSQQKVNEYYSWGEKLLYALEGTNAQLEKALYQEIQGHKNNR